MARKPKLRQVEAIVCSDKRQRNVKDHQKKLKPEDISVLEHWNSKGIIKHKPYNQAVVRCLETIGRRYTIDEITESINNYATVYYDEGYVPWPGYKQYRYTLPAYFRDDKAICDFMDDGQKWINYCSFKSNQLTQSATAENKTSRDSGTKEMSCISRTPEEALYLDCLTWLKTMQYKEYLESEHWQHFRKEAFKHFNGMCQLCGRTNDILELHHKTYINRGRETFNDVILLCTHCHELYHHNRDHCQCTRCNGESEQHEMLTM